MAQTQMLTRRIRSVKNARQITKALEVVAASRMRRVVEAVGRARDYGEMADVIMRRIAGNPEASQHQFFSVDVDKAPLYIIFTSDRGQAGAFNSNMFHLSLGLMRAEKQRPQVVVFGRKGSRFFSKLHNVELIGEYEGIEDVPNVNVFAPLAELLNDRLAAGSLGRVEVIYTQFVSSLSQKAANFQLLPIERQATQDETTDTAVYEFEPEMKDVMDEAIRLYFEARLLQARIESAASEQAMRMVAMGNATRNASDLIDDLTLELNATRQAAITQEIAEITGGAEAIAV